MLDTKQKILRNNEAFVILFIFTYLKIFFNQYYDTFLFFCKNEKNQFFGFLQKSKIINLILKSLFNKDIKMYNPYTY